jgi:hypothetical protein
MVLKHPEKLRLKLQFHFRHFIQEDRAVVRLLENSQMTIDGTGERATFVSEQLALYKSFPQCRTVDWNVSTLAIGMAVNLGGDNILTYAGLANDQNGRLRPRDLVDELSNLDNRLRPAEHWTQASESRRFPTFPSQIEKL